MEGGNLLGNLAVIRDRLLKCGDEAILRYASSDMKVETEQLWAEAKPQIINAIDEELKKLLEEFETTDKIAKLKKLRHEHATTGPSWTFSGNPSDDIRALRNVTAKKMEPEFEELYTEAEATTIDLNKICHQLKEVVASLDEELKNNTEEIRTLTEQLLQNTKQA